MAVHEIALERRTLHGHFSPDLEPVVSVEPGDSVRFAAPSSGWFLASGEQFEPRSDGLDDGHALIGPIEVRGARAGQTLSIAIDDVRVASWGVTLSTEPHVIRWELDDAKRVGRAGRWTVALAPFLGVLGMPPPEPGVHSTVPPRRWGGNIDCKELVAGSTLYLPVPVEGALFSAGDGHARQGDGEVSGTAIETPVEAEVTLDLRADLSLEWPVASTPDAWIAFGFDVDLDAAAAIARETMLDLMQRELGLDDRRDALALASVAVDLRVTQLVNQAVGVHALLRHDAIR
jgi:acetamidase/formamidase